jgi:hypothetical protein
MYPLILMSLFRSDPLQIDNGFVNFLVAFPPLKPAEFVVINVQQMTGRNCNSLVKNIVLLTQFLKDDSNQRAKYQVSRTLVHAGF